MAAPQISQYHRLRLLMCGLTLVSLPRSVDSEHTYSRQGLAWIFKSEDITCLSNTTATFNWTHTIVGEVNIAWTYKGTPNQPKADYILGFIQNSTYIPRGDWESRVGYINFPGSAVMILTEVTQSDVGIYEVRVINTVKSGANEPQYISAEVTLSVIIDTDIRFMVSIDGLTFDLTVAENGTRVMLPEYVMMHFAKLNVGVEVDSSTPQPRGIDIQNRVGNQILTDLSCAHSFVCERSVNFYLPGITTTNITITIIFGIQNLESVLVKQTVVIYSGAALETTAKTVLNTTLNEQLPKTDRASSMQIGLAVGGAVLVVIIVVLSVVVCVLRKKRQQEYLAVQYHAGTPGGSS